MDPHSFHFSTADAVESDVGVQLLNGSNEIGAMEISRSFTGDNQNLFGFYGINRWPGNSCTLFQFGL